MSILSQAKHVHFVGIGGVGLSALARVLLSRSILISGSDPAPNRLTEALARDGVRVYAGHSPEYVKGADLVVATSAVGDDHVEVMAAHAQGIPVVKRRELFEELSADYYTLAIAGSHGKTTTTAMTGLVLAEAGLDPSIVVGGIVPELGSNGREGQGRYLVIEADEYDRAFLGLEPEVAIVTNIDYDHPDLYPTRGDYQDAFLAFMGRVKQEGVLLACGDDIVTDELAGQVRKPVQRFGLGARNDWQAVELSVNAWGAFSWTALKQGQSVCRVELQVPGQHNVLNALAALAAAERVGVEPDQAARTLGRFRGVERRFQVVGEFNGATVIDDYAHHPTEIRSTLQAARQRYPGRRLIAVFQPHTFTRTRALADQFAAALQEADQVLVTEIYAAREHDETGLSGLAIVERMRHPNARFIPTLNEVQDYLSRHVQAQDVLLTLGAGDVNRVGWKLVDKHLA